MQLYCLTLWYETHRKMAQEMPKVKLRIIDEIQKRSLHLQSHRLQYRSDRISCCVYEKFEISRTQSVPFKFVDKIILHVQDLEFENIFYCTPAGSSTGGCAPLNIMSEPYLSSHVKWNVGFTSVLLRNLQGSFNSKFVAAINFGEDLISENFTLQHCVSDL